jgi:hypothetical protein
LARLATVEVTQPSMPGLPSHFLRFGNSCADTTSMTDAQSTELAWFDPRPEASNPPIGKGLIDERRRLHTWTAHQADHATEARDRGIQIAARLRIEFDGTALYTGGPMPERDALALAVEQDPRLRLPGGGAAMTSSET